MKGKNICQHRSKSAEQVGNQSKRDIEQQLLEEQGTASAASRPPAPAESPRAISASMASVVYVWALADGEKGKDTES